MRLQDKVALATGGAGGIGAATARRLAEDGARVVVADLDGAAAETVAKELRSDGFDSVAVRCDQTSEEEVAALFDGILRELGRLDVCFANAGWGRAEPFLAIKPATWRQIFDVNVTGTFLVCQAAAHRMIEHGNGGSIVLTTSSGAVQPAAFFSAYCSAKASLNMLVQVMAYELGAHDIRVNAVMPGVTATAMTQALLDTGAGDDLTGSIPLGRLAQPEDIAAVVAYLASDDSAYVTGTSTMIDGGGCLNGDAWFSSDFRKRGATDWQLRAAGAR